MKLNAPRLARVRSHFSHDGQFAQFTMVNKAGAHLSFTIPFSELWCFDGGISERS